MHEAKRPNRNDIMIKKGFFYQCKSMATLSLNKLKKRSPSDSSTKSKKKIDRFNGESEEEIQKYTLPDYLEMNLDMVIVGINPSLMGAHRGRYYAGPGNHFYKLLYESGLTPRFINYEEDYKLPQYGIGLTNIVDRPTRSSADIKRSEMKEGSKRVSEKILHFKPKIAIFNGKCIYEAYISKLDKSTFRFGLQPERIGDTAVWVVPSSSARCANYPRMVDKLHFYTALKKYLLLLKGKIANVDINDFFFNGKCQYAIPSTSKMWRRKNMSAFLYGGRVANKNTVCLDTTDENIASVRSTEFIVHLSQSCPDSDSITENITKGQQPQQLVTRETSQALNNVESPTKKDSDNVQLNTEEVKLENSENFPKNSNNDNDAPKKKRMKKACSKNEENDTRISRQKGKKGANRLSPKAIRNPVVRHNNKSLDFIHLIKQRIMKKAEQIDDIKGMSPNVGNLESLDNKSNSLIRTQLPECTNKFIDLHD